MGPPEGVDSLLSRAPRHKGRREPRELLHTANAVTTVDTLKAMQMQNCKFANVVVLSDEKLVAQLDCNDSTDGDSVLLNQIAKVDGVVQTNIIAVVRPVKH